MFRGDRIAELRKKLYLSQEDLAEALGTSRPSISIWETGKGLPDVNNLRELATALNTSTAYLLGETDDPAPPSEWLNARPDALKSSGRIISVPILGRELSACCGDGFDDPEQIAATVEGHVDMPAGFLGPIDPERLPFIIYAEGDSMSDAGIYDGAQVIINPADIVTDGDAALVDFAMTPVVHSIAIKRVYFLDGGAVEIRSACGDGWKRTFTRADAEEKSVRIVGKVVWICAKPKRG